MNALRTQAFPSSTGLVRGTRGAKPLGPRARRARIRQLIATRHIATQEELRALLAEEGFSCTQATLSRDLARLGARHVSQPDGGGLYELEELRAPPPADPMVRLPGIIRRIAEEHHVRPCVQRAPYHEILERGHERLERDHARRHDLPGERLHAAVRLSREDCVKPHRRLSLVEPHAPFDRQSVHGSRDAPRSCQPSDRRVEDAKLDVDEHAARADPPARHPLIAENPRHVIGQ